MALEVFKLVGRIGLEGTRTLEKNLNQVDQAAKQSAKVFENTGKTYAEMMKLQEQRLERYKDRFIEANDYFQSKSNQSSKMIGALSNQEGPINRVTASLLRGGEALERFTKSGTAANLAIESLGKNASMKDLLDRIKLINQGILRVQQLALGTTIIFAGLTAALVAGAKGPDPTVVYQQQAKAMAEYAKELDKRTQEIANTWSLFENAQYEHTKPYTLINNLEEQVKILRNWSNNLAELARRGVDEGLIKSLREMGPQAASQVQALVDHTDGGLRKFEALWREKWRLSREAAETELEAMKRATDQKVRELQNSLTPLGLAAERFKQVWADALGPFVEQFGIVAAAVVDFTTKIGEMWGAFNETNPELAKMVSWFIYLLPAIMLILSPLALGLKYMQGLRGVLFATKPLWQPFVTGFLRVVAPAAAATAAIVAIAFAIKEMWQNSEDLRTAFGNAMDAIGSAVSSALEPLGFWFDYLKGAFSALIIAITGGTGQAGNTFKTMGDTLASVINWIVGNILPIFKAGLSIAVTFIIGVIRAVTPVIQQMAMLFSQHSGTIKTVVTTAFQIIGTIIRFVMIGIVGTIQTYLQLALLAFRGIMNMISGVIQVFRGIFTGNWRAVWSGVVDILKGAGQLILAFLMATFLGRILGIFKSFISRGLGAIRGFGREIGAAFNVIGSTILRVMTNIYNWITGRIRAAINSALTSGRNLQTGLAAAFNAVLGAARTAFNAVKNAIMTPIESARAAIRTKVEEIKGFFTGLKLKLPEISLPPMPHFTLEYSSKTIMGKKIEYPTGFETEWYDKGGIFDSPSIIGVGEKRPEFVGALDDLRQIVREESAGTGFTGRIEVPVYLNKTEIARAIADDIDEQLEIRRRRNDRAAGRVNYGY